MKTEIIPLHLDNSGHTPLNLDQVIVRLSYLDLVTENNFYYSNLLTNKLNIIKDVANEYKNILACNTIIQIGFCSNDENLIKNLSANKIILIDARKSKLHKATKNRNNATNYELYNLTLSEFDYVNNPKIMSLDSMLKTKNVNINNSNILLNINVNPDNLLPILRGSTDTLKSTKILMVKTLINDFDKSIPIDLAIFLHSLNFKCIKLFNENNNNKGSKSTALFIKI